MSLKSRSRIFSLFLIPLLPTSAFAAPSRYLDDVFAGASVTSDIKYGANRNAAGTLENLFLDIYRPDGDTARSRPLFVFVHGGGFSGGTKIDGDIAYLCMTFAKKGYVTASIGYRLESPLNTAQTMGTAVFRAVQDAKAAVRYLRAHKAEFGIDDARIMLGGTSAGGALSLQYAYLDAGEVPSYVDTAALGGLEGGTGSPGVSSAINGAMNCWGGVGDSAMLNNGKLPVISFHGTEDKTVPYDIGYSLGNPNLVTFGSACVHRVLSRVGVRTVLKPFIGMGHGFPVDARADTIVAMTAGFAYEILFGKPAFLGESRQAPVPRLAARSWDKLGLMAIGTKAVIARTGHPGWSAYLADGRQLPYPRLPIIPSAK